MGVPNWGDKTVWTGDNLRVMRGMNSQSVDLVYLDPPFNSKQDYAAPIGSVAAGAAFKDTWTLTDLDAEWINLIEDKHPALWRVLLAATTNSDKSYLVYMAVRLLEIYRLMKPTGSIYLHCDPTMSHYLKLVMDAVFGRRNFRNEIIWQRTSSRNDASRWGGVHDAILFYSRGARPLWNRVFQPHDPEYVRNAYRYSDGEGQYRLHEIIRTASMGERPNLAYEYKGYRPQWGWRLIRSKVKELDDAGRLVWSDNGRPYVKRYLHEHPGSPIKDVITDISPALGRQRTGYPTQKPLALLERIIKASSSAGDVVLDPFCGCATTMVAANDLGRSWVGIDISPKAAELIRLRLKGQVLFSDILHRDDLPQRTDLGILPAPHAHRAALYGDQGGYCAGCATHFEPQHLEVDHIIAKSKGGTDHVDNLQLLCGSCNRVKGNRGMEYLKTRLRLGS